ncbi:DUF502 domain-containing protein [Halorhabdus sp. SVX81]|uniref:DUF502 domain-containing protein n=1 Tax=Halorhabdus sp. SVX81 TaxID=2978283 RepID=UPI0023DA709F|nr:DUF502 domain-containing protein [Halorhabdus sp. SVX81]
MSRAHTLRRSFVAGLFLVAPLVVTIVALRLLIGWLSGFVDPIVSTTALAQYTGNITLVAQVITFLTLIFVITSLGYLTQRSIGDWAFSWFDRAFGIVPVVRVIYTSVRQMTQALRNRENRYENVVLIEYPREGLFAIGFVTGESPASTQSATGKAYNVFVPHSPNITGGRLVLAPEDTIHEIDISVRRAIRLLMTTGIAEEQSDVDALASETNVDIPDVTDFESSTTTAAGDDT